MGLFDFFKKKDKAKETNLVSKTPNPSESSEAPKKVDTSIEIVSVDNGSHGDNFGGLIGFEFLNSEIGSNFINEYIAVSTTKAPDLKNDHIAIHQVRFNEIKGILGNLGIRTLTTNQEILSAYPYLRTDYIIPFSTKTIQEWSHVNSIEAEIKGGGRDIFGLGFFATDYAVNKEIYKSNKAVNIRLSAIGLVLDKSDITEIGGQPISEGFASYMPNSDIPRPTYYDFIGVLMNYTPITLTGNNKGYLTRIKLINEERDPNFFTVDMFINQGNMRIEDLEINMRVTGALWFQGELA